MVNQNQGDPEITAMSVILDALKDLPDEAKSRVLNWVAQKVRVTPPTPQIKSTDMVERVAIREGTINTVAVRLGVKSCKDLLIAAAIHLTLFQGKERFTRNEWVECARESKQWKSAYSVQTSTVIGRLLSSGFVNETSKDTYVVPDEQLQQYATNLGQ